jgi:hypothetical protein
MKAVCGPQVAGEIAPDIADVYLQSRRIRAPGATFMRYLDDCDTPAAATVLVEWSHGQYQLVRVDRGRLRTPLDGCKLSPIPEVVQYERPLAVSSLYCLSRG